jgi:hypothetical protein
MTPRLRRRAASVYLLETHGIERAPGTLAKLATIGGGPVFQRVGRVPLYSPSDLDDWALSLLSGPMLNVGGRGATLGASRGRARIVAAKRGTAAEAGAPAPRA